MPSRNVVVIGASAGGLEALSIIIGALPASLPAFVLAVVHSAPHGGTLLPDILQRVTALPVAFADDGDRPRQGRVYLAPSDRHLLIRARKLTLGRGPREHGFRPAIDPLFRTAAREFGARAIGVVLSGALSDGSYGLGAIKAAGGAAIVQNPQEAKVGTMPLNTMNEETSTTCCRPPTSPDSSRASYGRAIGRKGQRHLPGRRVQTRRSRGSSTSPA
jgi:two-component system chemotaxis response regulator CheB